MVAFEEVFKVVSAHQLQIKYIYKLYYGRDSLKIKNLSGIGVRSMKNAEMKQIIPY